MQDDVVYFLLGIGRELGNSTFFILYNTEMQLESNNLSQRKGKGDSNKGGQFSFKAHPK